MDDDLFFIIIELLEILEYINFNYNCLDAHDKIKNLYNHVLSLKKDRD